MTATAAARPSDLSGQGLSRDSPGSAPQIGRALSLSPETLRLVAEIGMGQWRDGFVVGGTVAIIGFVTPSGGSLIAIHFASNIGVVRRADFCRTGQHTSLRPLSPVSRYRDGAGATAQLGAMRISEEIRRAGSDGHQVDLLWSPLGF